MTKNPIKLIRNPNSPEAIQARLDGYTDPTPYSKVQLIDCPDAPYIYIDLTEVMVDQLVNYPILGGRKNDMPKKLVRTSLHTDNEGRPIITNYYTDVRDQQWVIIKSFLNRDLPGTPNHPSLTPVPRPTYGNTFGAGIAASARGENWRNEGKSVDKLRAAQKKKFARVAIDPNADETKDHPEDRYVDDFTGER